MTLRRALAPTLLTMTLLIAAFAVSPVRAETGKVYHTVVFWLKADTPSETVEEITRSVKALGNLSMVESVVVGTPVMSEREVVDDSFSIAFTMTFKDEAALAAYGNDPEHKKSSKFTLQHVTRGVIYDYKGP
jgi:hypothetical protein